MDMPAQAYDPPPTSARSSLDDGRSSSSAYRYSNNSIRPPQRQQISYAPPGSTSSSINPASTVAFMLNMGYPPPPIALEPLRRLLEQMTQGPGQVLNIQQALSVTDEITRSPYRIAPAVLFVVQQRLHSSKPDRVALALELLDMCVKNCGLDFVKHINKEFMKSLVSVVKTTSFKERTFTGQMKKLEKYIMGSPSASGVATDPRVHKLRRQALTLIQNWADAFMMHQQQVAPILDAYKSLRRKGVQFPPRDASQKFLVKHAENSPAFDGHVPGVGQGDENSVLAAEAELAKSPTDAAVPFTERQFTQLEKLIQLLRTSDDQDLVARALEMCDRLRPKLEESLKLLQTRISQSHGRKLKGSDPRVAQLNAILDLDAEVKKRRGFRLLYAQPNSPQPQPAAVAAPVAAPVAAVAAPVAAVNLLDDLLGAEDSAGDTRPPEEPFLPSTQDPFAGLTPETRLNQSAPLASGRSTPDTFAPMDARFLDNEIFQVEFPTPVTAAPSLNTAPPATQKPINAPPSSALEFPAIATAFTTTNLPTNAIPSTATAPVVPTTVAAAAMPTTVAAATVPTTMAAAAMPTTVAAAAMPAMPTTVAAAAMPAMPTTVAAPAMPAMTAATTAAKEVDVEDDDDAGFESAPDCWGGSSPGDVQSWMAAAQTPAPMFVVPERDPTGPLWDE